jgi:hypothetical protein
MIALARVVLLVSFASALGCQTTPLEELEQDPVGRGGFGEVTDSDAATPSPGEIVGLLR